MSMLQSCIRRTGPLSAKIHRIRAERVAAGLLKEDEPEPVVVLISENGGALVEEDAPPLPPRNLIKRLAADDIKAVKLDGIVYPTISEIQAATCEFFGVEKIDLLSQRRTTAIIVPRQVAVYLCKKLTLHSYPVIAKRFGGRDHTTALSAVRRVQTLMDRDREFADKVNELKATFRNELKRRGARQIQSNPNGRDLYRPPSFYGRRLDRRGAHSRHRRS